MTISTLVMSAMFWRWGFWVRVPREGWGIAVRRDSRPLFSERNGSRMVWQWGRWAFELMRPRS